MAVREQRQRPAQIAAVDILECEEVLVADPSDLEDLCDVDVLQLDRDLRLVDEPRDELLVGHEVRQDLLDHRELLEPCESVLGEENLSHSAARQPLDKQVPPEYLREARILATEWCAQWPFVRAGLQS